MDGMWALTIVTYFGLGAMFSAVARQSITTFYPSRIERSFPFVVFFFWILIIPYILWQDLFND